MLYSFCDNARSNLEALAAAIAARILVTGTFELTESPVADTIVVRIDGVETADHWSYDLESNSVVLDEGHEPADGSEVESEYSRYANCDRWVLLDPAVALWTNASEEVRDPRHQDALRQ